MFRSLATVAVLAAVAAAPASAAVTLITSQTSFQAAGPIAQSTNFDSFGTGFTSLSNPYTIGDLTFTSGDNLVVGTATGFGSARNLLAFNGWTPMTGTIAGTHSLFGFKMTVLGANSLVNVTILTNQGSYSFNGLTPAANPALSFYGFQAGAGEYFTGFTLASTLGPGSAPSTTDYLLGSTGAVPEPASWAMLIAGFGLVGAIARRRRRALAA